MVFGLQLMTKSKDLLNKERATIFFQPLVYALKDSLVIIEQKHNVCDMSSWYVERYSGKNWSEMFIFLLHCYIISFYFDLCHIMSAFFNNWIYFSCSLLLRTLIETIIDLVQSFDLTWQDSIETISVMDIACEFLQYDIWDQRVTNHCQCYILWNSIIIIFFNVGFSVPSKTIKPISVQIHVSWNGFVNG